SARRNRYPERRSRRLGRRPHDRRWLGDFSHIRSRASHTGTQERGSRCRQFARRQVSLHETVSRVRVRYAETDQMGVLYSANYFVWFEVGRTDLLRDSGLTYRELEAEGVSLPVIEAHCEYH